MADILNDSAVKNSPSVVSNKAIPNSPVSVSKGSSTSTPLLNGSLGGFGYTLNWSDFSKKEEKEPDKPVAAAYTYTTYSSYKYSYVPIKGSKPVQFQLSGNLFIKLTLNKEKSFVKSWIFQKTQQFQDDLLHHEQGHYNITSLVVRDFLEDVILLRYATFATAQDSISAVNQIEQQSLKKIQSINDLYDNEIHPEQISGQSRGPKQKEWDSYLNIAFNQNRTDGAKSSDGTPCKMRLVDVLSLNGKLI